MTEHYKTLTLVSALAAAVTACGGGSAASASQSDTAAADTPAVAVSAPLSDTVYASVGMIKPRVRVLDTVTPGRIDDFTDPYRSAPGVFTFRANYLRDADMGGRVEGCPSDIVVDWVFETTTDTRETGFGRWGGGTGWTGQPLYVEWPDSVLRRFRSAGHLAEGFSGREIIVGSLAAQLYFIDFNTGKASRTPIALGNPIKGTGSIDPSMNGNFYIGHGVPAERPFGALVVDLNRHKVSDIVPEDPWAIRRWGAYDPSPLRVGRFLIRHGENGIIYKYTVTPGGLKLHSEMQYTGASGGSPGIESSMSVYRNYGYTADNHGYVVCTNLDNMQPVWVYASGDDNDASTVITVENDRPYVYCSSEIDRQGTGTARLAKLDGLTGEPVWEKRIPGARFDNDGKHFDGGFYSTPLPGKGNCSHLLFSNMVYNTRGQNGSFIAVDRATGETVYEVPLRVYAWSSPVGFVNSDDRMFVLTGDCGGNLYLIDGADGTVIKRKPVGSNFESSPVVVGNSAVVGSRGNSIFKVSLK